MCQYCINPFRQPEPKWDQDINARFGTTIALDLHRSFVEYSPTPVVSLPALANRLGVGHVFVKDESLRFGLKAFKVLGASYAIYRLVCRHVPRGWLLMPSSDEFYGPNLVIPSDMFTSAFTFCTATDGNHGRGVAWVARKLKQRAVIYMPRNSVSARIEAIEAEGAEVKIVDGTYDDAVLECTRDAAKNGWQIISDTSWTGYTEIPMWIMEGYTTIFREIHDEQIGHTKIDVVFIQAGVGALAATAAWFFNKAYSPAGTKLVSVEPTVADCLLESIRSDDGYATWSHGQQDSIMAGLNCGMPSVIAWPMIKAGFDLFMTIPDEYCIKAMRTYFYPQGRDPRIISGESGAAGLAALLTLCEKDSMAPAREFLDLNRNSTILLLNTEGDTDPEMFNKLVG